jgi:hypothetical protein
MDREQVAQRASNELPPHSLLQFANKKYIIANE